MTLYSFVLFVHVVSALGLFIGLALEGFVSLRIRMAQDAEELRFFTRAFDRLRWIYIPSLAGILFGGMYLASNYGGGTFWIPASLAALVAIMLIGGLITGRKMHQLKNALAKTGADFGALASRGKDIGLAVSYGLRSGLALAIVFLMTAKPETWPAVVALSSGCLGGLLIAVALPKIAAKAGAGCGPVWRRQAGPSTTALAR